MHDKEIKQKLKRIEEVKHEISGLGEIRTGSLSEQWNVCGNPKCRCKDKENPQKHGPYYQLSYTRYGKSSTEFVSRKNVDTVRKQLEDYKAFMSLKDEWIDLSVAIAKLRKAKK